VIEEQVELYETLTGEHELPPAPGEPGQAPEDRADVLPFRRSAEGR
jgi:hypothetical protein